MGNYSKGVGMAKRIVYGFEQGDFPELEELKKMRESGELQQWSLFELLLKYSQDRGSLGYDSGDIVISHAEHTFWFRLDKDDPYKWSLEITSNS
jgi:hypothetical protein